jgi:hypothetical protein
MEIGPRIEKSGSVIGWLARQIQGSYASPVKVALSGCEQMALWECNFVRLGLS